MMARPPDGNIVKLTEKTMLADPYTAGMPGSADDRDSAAKCPFCAIIRGESAATRILETDHLLAFLDIRPLFRGHTLLVPKTHLRLLSDLPATLAAEFLTTAQRLERAVEDGLGAAGSMILVNNVVSQSVPHLHLHVIPRNPKDGLRFWLGPRHGYDAEHPAGEYAEKIRAALLPPGITPPRNEPGACRGSR
jgi:histidine triad (HIT) family protein